MSAGETIVRAWSERLAALRPSSRPRALMMPAWYATAFADTLLFVASVLEHSGVRYVAHRGTLLGAARLAGLLPWDDDADLFVFDEDASSLERKIGALLRAHGFVFEFRHGQHYFWAYPRTIWRFPLAGLIEIGLLTKTHAADGSGPVFDAHEPARRITPAQLLPCQRVGFYGSYLFAPNDTDGVLERYYGELATPHAMAAFERPAVSREHDAFWTRARPRDGALDWPAIRSRFSDRARSPAFQLAQGPCSAYWLANRAHWLATDVLRALGERARP